MNWTKEALQKKVDELGPWHYCHLFPFGVVTGTSIPDGIGEKMGRLLKHDAFPRPNYQYVLDLGANSGIIDMWFADNKFSTVTAVEFGPKYYPQLELAVEVKGYSGKIIPQYQDIYTCDFGVNKYDLILFLGTMHHLSSDKHRDVLKACLDALLPGGEIIVQTKTELPVLEMFTNIGYVHYKKLYDFSKGGRSAWKAMKDVMKPHNDYYK